LHGDKALPNHALFSLAAAASEHSLHLEDTCKQLRQQVTGLEQQVTGLHATVAAMAAQLQSLVEQQKERQ
jgi:phage shock protein A